MIRQAAPDDIARIAEISVFAKRAAYRRIFNDDAVSFGEMTVLSYAQKLQKPGMLDNTYVCDEGFVRGFMRIDYTDDSAELVKLFVDPLLQGEGCGSRLMEEFLRLAAAQGKKRAMLWVLEENTRAVAFYRRFGFAETGDRGEAAPGVAEIMMAKEL